MTSSWTKEKHAAYATEYWQNNKDRLRKYRREWARKNRKKTYEKFRNDSDRVIAHNLRCRLYQALRLKYKAGSAVKDLGCSVSDFRLHIEKMFTEEMSWDNYGEWHLDHVVPLASFDLTKREDFLKAAHYTNYQPLWAADNIRKGAQLAYT